MRSNKFSNYEKINQITKRDAEPAGGMIGVTALSRRNFKLEKSLKCKRFSFIPFPESLPPPSGSA